jgi:hypothetical protein
VHAAKIERAFAEETGAAFHMMAQNTMTQAKRHGFARLGGTKDRHHRHLQQCGEMHGAGVVREQQVTCAQFGDQFFQGCFTDSILHVVSQGIGYLHAERCVVLSAQKNPLHRKLGGGFLCDFGKSLRQPTLGGAILSARTERKFQRLAPGINCGRRWEIGRNDSADCTGELEVFVSFVADSAFFRFRRQLVE